MRFRAARTPGTIHLLTPEGIATQRSASAHDVNLATALEFGRRAGARLPENSRIRLVAIEAADTLTFGEHVRPRSGGDSRGRRGGVKALSEVC